jgi:hypothetical protein
VKTSDVAHDDDYQYDGQQASYNNFAIFTHIMTFA